MQSTTQIKVFLQLHQQNVSLNQYWYSANTIRFLQVQASKHHKCCFLSTPSIYYAMDRKKYPHSYYLFDFDPKFAKGNPNYFQYDFNHPQQIPSQYHNYFDFVLADPPFITSQVWSLYTKAINLITTKDQEGQINAKILLSTIEENQQFLKSMLNVHKCIFKPSIPNLVYQYALFCNYEDEELNQVNPEIKQQ